MYCNGLTTSSSALHLTACNMQIQFNDGIPLYVIVDSTSIAPPPYVLPEYGNAMNAQAQQREEGSFARGGGGVFGRARIYVQPEWHDCANRFWRCADHVLIGQTLAEAPFTIDSSSTILTRDP